MRPIDSQALIAAAATATIHQRVAAAYEHDFRGSLQAVQGALDLVARIGRSGAPDPERLEKAIALANRAVASHAALMSGMLSRLLGTSLRPDEPSPGLGTLLREAVSLLRHEAEGAGVTVDASIIADPASPAGDPHGVFVLLIGLVSTALDTIERGGRLALCLSHDAAAVTLTLGLGRRCPWDRTPTGEIRTSGDLVLRYAANYLEQRAGSVAVELGGSNAGLLVVRYALTAQRTG